MGRGSAGRDRVVVPLVQELLRRIAAAAVRRGDAARGDAPAGRAADDALERTIGTHRQQATRDALTGLFSRLFLESHLPQVVRRCAKQRADVTVVMADLDYLNSLNDTLGREPDFDQLEPFLERVLWILLPRHNFRW